MEIWVQIVLFAVPGAVIYYGVHRGVPRALGRGRTLLWTFFGWLWVPVFLLAPLTLALYRFREGGTLSLAAMASRFRFVPLTGRDWFLVAGGVILTLVTEEALSFTSRRLARVSWLKPPDYLPAPFHPHKSLTLPLQSFMGTPLRGNWPLFCVFVPLHALAMFSEELMWRGYLLPLQEAAYGGWAVVINGVLWAWVLHACLKWHLVAMLPGMLVAPFVAWQTGSTWGSLLVHGLSNAVLWGLLLAGILGVGSVVPKERGGTKS